MQDGNHMLIMHEVLILVVMDNSLVQYIGNTTPNIIVVLILVVMDNSLVLT